MKRVTFVRHDGIYNSGETAGFDDHVAAEMVEVRKVAVYADAPARVVDVPAIVKDTPVVMTGEAAVAAAGEAAEALAVGKKGKRGK